MEQIIKKGFTKKIVKQAMLLDKDFETNKDNVINKALRNNGFTIDGFSNSIVIMTLDVLKTLGSNRKQITVNELINKFITRVVKRLQVFKKVSFDTAINDGLLDLYNYWLEYGQQAKQYISKYEGDLYVAFYVNIMHIVKLVINVVVNLALQN